MDACASTESSFCQIPQAGKDPVYALDSCSKPAKSSGSSSYSLTPVDAVDVAVDGDGCGDGVDELLLLLTTTMGMEHGGM